MNKNKLIEELEKIKNDLNHYANKPNFINLIENITKKEKIIENLLLEFEEKLEEGDYSNEIKKIDKFIKKFEKKYVEKIERFDGVIYEYENNYKFYPNKKSNHIAGYFKDKFRSETFDEIIIDNIKRNEKKFTQEILTDIKHSNSCFIIINKIKIK